MGSVLVGVLAVAPANAAPQAPPLPVPPGSASVTSSLTPAKPGNGGFGVTDVSPSGCVGQVNNPHVSSHFPDTVNAGNNPVPDIYAEGELLSLISGVWTLAGFDTNLDFQASKVSAFPNEPLCSGTHTYGVIGFHEVTDVDFEDYAATTFTPPVSVTCASN